MNKLSVTNLCKTYDAGNNKVEVLKDVTFSIEKGEMVVIMGPSGSGKSTLLYSVSGMEPVTSGTINFFGKSIANLNNKEMSDLRLDEMGFVFQQMYMLKDLTIMDNIVLPAYKSKNKKKDRKAINERAKKLMECLGIVEIGSKKIYEVSGGQLQRACICRSLINDPKIVFADEPTGALNQNISNEVMKEFNIINQDGTTILLVTHDMRVASKGDHIIYIEDGNIKGNLVLGKCKVDEDMKQREKEVSDWLRIMGW